MTNLDDVALTQGFPAAIETAVNFAETHRSTSAACLLWAHDRAVGKQRADVAKAAAEMFAKSAELLGAILAETRPDLKSEVDQAIANLVELARHE